MKPLLIPPLEIPLRAYATQANAILGLRGSGKSMGAGSLAEQMMEEGIPIIVFDPIGIWKNLKVPGRGKGYPVVVAATEKGDLPLTPKSAPEIVRAAMAANVSLVIDLFSVDLSKGDWRKIVMECSRILLHENHKYGLRHLFLEEAGEFVPQRIQPNQGEVYAEVEKLVRMGGNKSIGVTLINPRAEGVNKEVLELCDCVMMLRQKGRNSVANLEKWINLSDPESSKQIIQSMSKLKPGECWVWPQDQDAATLCRFNLKSSFHPDRKNPQHHAIGKAVDVGAFVAQLSGSLETVIEEAKANDPAELKKRIRELERQAANVQPAEKPVPIRLYTDQDVTELLSVQDAIRELHPLVDAVVERARKIIDPTLPTLEQVQAIYKMNAGPAPDRNFFLNEQHEQHVSKSQARRELTQARHERNGTLGRCERAILTALSIRRNGMPVAELAIRTVYAPSSGGFNNALGTLRGQGLITKGGVAALTDAGMKYKFQQEPHRERDELIAAWCAKLGRCERAILERLVRAYPKPLHAIELGADTGYSPSSGGFNNAIGHLRSLELIARGWPTVANGILF